MHNEHCSPQQRLEAWKLLSTSPLDQDTAKKLQELGFSQRDSLGLFFEYVMHTHFSSKETGKITQLPASENVESTPVNPLGLTAFVQSYVGWTLDETEITPSNNDDIVAFWLQQGHRHLRNTDAQTTRLLRWMQENPEVVADYLDAAWTPELSRDFTEPFRQKAHEKTLPKLNIPEL